MQERALLALLPQIYNAALDPASWPSVVARLCTETSAFGGTYFVLSRRSNRIVSMHATGIAQDLVKGYVDRYYKSDPYRRRFDELHRKWLPLSKIKAETNLNGNEWYHDFVGKEKVKELAAIRLVDNKDLVVGFGLQFDHEVCEATWTTLKQVSGALAQAAHIDIEMRARRWQAQLAAGLVKRLAMGIIIVNERGQVIEINEVADGILAQGDGLSLRLGRIAPGRAFEANQFDARLAAALGPADVRQMSRMLVGRPSGRRAYILTLIPSDEHPGSLGRVYATILINDPDRGLPTEADFAELYGLSLAESRLAARLVRGRRIGEIGAETGVQPATLRTQVRSILRKVGVQRSADLLRVLTGGLSEECRY